MPVRPYPRSFTALLLFGVLILAGGYWGLRTTQDVSTAQAAGQQLARLRPKAVSRVLLSTPDMTADEVAENRFVRTRVLTDTAAIRALIQALQQSVPYDAYQGKPSGPWRMAVVLEQRNGTKLHVQVYANAITHLVFVVPADGAGPRGLNDFLVNRSIGPVLVHLMQVRTTS